MKRAEGFTLIELSIVLVIIGLLVGGVLGGRELIRSSEFTSIVKDAEKYKTAYHTFKMKYNALPGDMPNAVTYWGAQAGGLADGADATCQAVTTASTGMATCNGDGNNQINPVNERYRAWQHLANAGLIAGSFSGVPGPGSAYDCVPGTNSPESKLSGVSWVTGYTGRITASPTIFDGFYGNTLEVRTTVGSPDPYDFATPTEMQGMDAKIDDGKPGSGQMRPYSPGKQPNCTTSTNPALAAYNVSYTSLACSPLIMTGY